MKGKNLLAASLEGQFNLQKEAIQHSFRSFMLPMCQWA